MYIWEYVCMGMGIMDAYAFMHVCCIFYEWVFDFFWCVQHIKTKCIHICWATQQQQHKIDEKASVGCVVITNQKNVHEQFFLLQDCFSLSLWILFFLPKSKKKKNGRKMKTKMFLFFFFCFICKCVYVSISKKYSKR